MAPHSGSGGSVLIIDADAGIRRLIAAVLEHAGFRTVGVKDLQSAAAMLKTSTFAAIVRDLNLAPAERRRSLQQLAATEPELLRRTVVMTTAPSRAETALAAGTVFAIVGKPFDIENLLNVVRACARGSREASVKLESLRQFARSVPSLQQLLSNPVCSQREAALRAEMRRTLRALAATLTEAAHEEASRPRAAVFRAALAVATQLASVPAPGTTLAERGRDH
jgi:DNA-binding NtrC family response regulator